MPRRSILSAAERESLLALPDTEDQFIQHYTFSESDLSLIAQRRGDHNRLGFAVQMCCLRYPGFVLPTDAADPPAPLMAFVGRQLQIEPDVWPQYAQRPETRREHLVELQTWLNLTPFAITDYRHFIHHLAELAQKTDRGILLAETLIGLLRHKRILLPTLDVIERVCSEALTQGTRQVYEALTSTLDASHRHALDGLLILREGTRGSGLVWLRQPPGPANPKHILIHLERLKTVGELRLPDGLEHGVHQNRLLKLAREGGQMTAQHLRDLEPARRYATLVAVILDTRATLVDEIIDQHDRFLGALFSKAKRSHSERFQQSGKAINDKVTFPVHGGHLVKQNLSAKHEVSKCPNLSLNRN